ncbi:MAG TPA: hypothetical protein VL200_12785 [Lacunisphaera sp.]|jgi:hypothetical protein|nr:hypothetical protein [Lacunisphaera sp.]
MNPKILLAALVLAAFPVVSVRADLMDNLTIDIRLGRRAPPPPPAVVVVVPDNDASAPGPWARRGHWYQRNQAYYYYPADDVYYRQSDQTWFYLERGQWRSGRRLPDTVRVDFNRSVTLSMFTDRPYTYHQQVVARYPANYFGTRVRLRDDNRRDDRRADRPDNRGGDGRRDDNRNARDQDRDKDRHDNRNHDKRN